MHRRRRDGVARRRSWPGARAAVLADCAGASTGLVPLTELGTTAYGFAGGLYGAGANEPPAPHAALAAARRRIVPRAPRAGRPPPTALRSSCSAWACRTRRRSSARSSSARRASAA
ncbi:MAG: hypothetical protein U0470_13200 [Anaerolineae bacterium]